MKKKQIIGYRITNRLGQPVCGMNENQIFHSLIEANCYALGHVLFAIEMKPVYTGDIAEPEYIAR